MGRIQNIAVGVPTCEKTTVPDSTGSGEGPGPTPKEIADAIGAKADAEVAANAAGLAAAGDRQEAETDKRRVKEQHQPRPPLAGGEDHTRRDQT
jgi:hypothetical protein